MTKTDLAKMVLIETAKEEIASRSRETAIAVVSPVVAIMALVTAITAPQFVGDNAPFGSDLLLMGIYFAIVGVVPVGALIALGFANRRSRDTDEHRRLRLQAELELLHRTGSEVIDSGQESRGDNMK